MRFLKADFNLHLLAVVLAVLVVFAGFSIYYQNKIKEMQREYDKKAENLKSIEEKLLSKEEKLNEISELKEVIKKDKETLEIGYLSLHSENQNLKTEKINLMEDLETRPFGKTLCKATGNVQCLN